MRRGLTPILFTAALAACANPGPQRDTLARMDIVGQAQHDKRADTKATSDAQIRAAYAEYLAHASKNDKSRIAALNRLAQLEFELSEELLKTHEKKDQDRIRELDDRLYTTKLNRTIELLETAVTDYPDAPGNDKTLYQLARARDQVGNYDGSLSALRKLVKRYPKSPYYIESQFRLAEAAFSAKQYRLAEDKYTDIIGRKNNRVFYDKSLYKRGWARFKQGFYIEAVDDFVTLIKHREFKDIPTLTATRKNEFEEYFRAVGLAFAYMGGTNDLKDYMNVVEDFPHRYYAYRYLSDIYLKQQRYSDAVTAIRDFARDYPDSRHVPKAHLRAIAIWEDGGFRDKMNDAVAVFYDRFNPQSNYWHKNKNIDQRNYDHASSRLRQYILTAAANHHERYDTHGTKTDFEQARRWYRRYLEHYEKFARKDNVHFLFGSLLEKDQQTAAAFAQFKQAAFDGELITNKDAAYKSIQLASRLSKAQGTGNDTLGQQIHFSTLYAQQYPNDSKTPQIIANASERAYRAGNYKAVIKLSENIASGVSRDASSYINTLRGHSYVKLKDYAQAEAVYRLARAQAEGNAKRRQNLNKSLALAIYKQGQNAAEQGDVDTAVGHYTRLLKDSRATQVAPTGLYDAIALLVREEHWARAIALIKRFQAHYPNHRYAHEVDKKLSVAYLNSKQDVEAARQLERVSEKETDQDYKKTALWKAGELYESKGERQAAIRSYTSYARNFTQPFDQYMEAMHKLVGLHSQNSNVSQANRWRQRLIDADRRTPKGQKTDRTRRLASEACLALARHHHRRFDNIRLSLPLKASLARKKTAMREAVNLYGRASSYGVAETATQATYSIAELYRSFSVALLESDRPAGLSEAELTQYQILLEDKAFPFEEKAIEFYETTLTHVRDGIYDEWMKKSQRKLEKLFPVRYARNMQLDRYINVLH